MVEHLKISCDPLCCPSLQRKEKEKREEEKEKKRKEKKRHSDPIK